MICLIGSSCVIRLPVASSWYRFRSNILRRPMKRLQEEHVDRTTSQLAHQGKPSLCKKFTVAIEGNIASGKTTLLKYFSRFPEVMIYEEPVNQWRDMKGYNLLNLMYKDTSQWSFAFQSYVQLTMVRVHREQHKESTSVKLMERSIFAARYCFVENLFQRGLMTKPEYIILSEWFDWLIANEDIQLHLIVYLRTTPDISLKRIRERHRPEEAAISLEYLKNLHNLHDDWLLTKRNFNIPCPVLVLDTSCDFDEMEVLFEKCANEILHCNELSTQSTSDVAILSST